MKKKIFSIRRGIVIILLLSVFYYNPKVIECCLSFLMAVALIYFMISIVVHEIKSAMQSWKEVFQEIRKIKLRIHTMKTKLFIIGNGFDRAHGLPTRYIDYRDYLFHNYPDFLKDVEEAYSLNPEDIEWWQDFENNLGLADRFESDFENMGLSVIDNMVDNEGEPMPDIENALRIYFADYYEFMNKLNETVCEWAKTIDLDDIEKITGQVSNEESLYLNFNYTNVLEDVYDIDYRNVCHIHGGVTDGYAIMGHGNNTRINNLSEEIDKENKKMNYNYAEILNGIYEFYKESLKPVRSIIDSNESFFASCSGVETVYVCGHSAGEVDRPYFLRIKNTIQPDAKWVFYYFDDGSCSSHAGYEEKWREVLGFLDLDSSHLQIEDVKHFYDL